MYDIKLLIIIIHLATKSIVEQSRKLRYHVTIE